MFNKIRQAAEKMATNVSRRHFLGSLGRWAGAVALGMAGLLVPGKEAQASGGGVWCNVYQSTLTGEFCAQCRSYSSPPPGWQLYSMKPVNTCTPCFNKYGRCPF